MNTSRGKTFSVHWRNWEKNVASFFSLLEGESAFSLKKKITNFQSPFNGVSARLRLKKEKKYLFY